ncbi:MAG: SIR2 family protein [Bacillota bacterium]
MAQTNKNTQSSPQELLSNASFEIGGEDKMVEYYSAPSAQLEGEENPALIEDAWKKCITDVQIRLGTILKTDTMSFLFGAGASKDCGGVLIGAIPIEVERELLREGVNGKGNFRVRKWLRYFYLAAKYLNYDDTNIPTGRNEIVQRWTDIENNTAVSLAANYESILSLLYRWRMALPKQGGRLRIDGTSTIDMESGDLDICLHRATHALAQSCQLPRQGSDEGFDAYKLFVRKILTRPLNLKRTNVFTLNYDTLVEQAADAEGVVLIDGFVGTLKRIFRPECYDQDLYFPAETTEGRVHRHDRVVHLYKLHGSIMWVSETPGWDNPYGLAAKAEPASVKESVLIYPTPAKYGETLGMPYAELFRRFAVAVVRPQSTLFVIGYGFGDEHVNAIIRQALAVPSFALVIIDPNPQSDFVNILRKQKDQRVWIFSGKTFGTFTGFVKYALPDLRDEDVRRRVIETHRALKEGPPYDGQ